jgi:hypothetical protein
MKKFCTYVFILCWLLPVKLFAQQEDITGMWYGELTIIDTQKVNLPYEIAVSEEKGKLFGYSRIVFHANGKDEAGVQNISIRRKGNNIVMEDEGFITHNFSINPSRHVKKRMIVVLTTTDTEMILEGSWSTNLTRYNKPYKGTVLLKRKIDFKKLELFKSLDTLNLAPTLSFINKPQTEAVVAVAAPLEKKPEPLPVVPVPDPVLIIPPIEKASPGLLAVTKKMQPSTAKISPLSKQLQIDPLTKAKMEAVVKAASIPPKPADVTVIAAAPKPETKTPPSPKSEPQKKTVVIAVEPKPEKKTLPPPKSEPEKKPVVVAVQPQPKPPPPHVTIVVPSVVHGAAEIEKRVTKSDQSFYFESDSLLLTLYDNGEVDGDTVTVLMNGNVIFSKAGLTTIANSKTIFITPDMDSVKLVMYAENLGSIPPNTGLLIVNDGEKRYEVRFRADLQTNAAIVLRRKKKA